MQREFSFTQNELLFKKTFCIHIETYKQIDFLILYEVPNFWPLTLLKIWYVYDLLKIWRVYFLKILIVSCGNE